MHDSLWRFKTYVEYGLLREVISPCGKLVLWNYTDRCVYERAWDEVTLNARGTVYEIETGRVVARAFPKFFNFGELPKEKQREVLNSKDFEVYEKMDGSLGIVYYYDGEWRVNTRGSFTSDQAIRGKEILKKYNTSGLEAGHTFLMEIIYPENRIIVDYGNKEELVMLAEFDKDGDELEIEMLRLLHNFRICPKKKFSTIEELQEHLETLDHNEEGYVVRFGNGERVKFKSAEYLRLARILSNMSPLAFWEKMEYGKIDREFLEQLPEEFRDECDEIADKLEYQYLTIQNEVSEKTTDILIEVVKDGVPENVKKAIGLYLKENKTIHSPAVFPAYLGNKEALDKYIKKQIKPVGNVMKDI